jgi:hypothetical protein
VTVYGIYQFRDAPLLMPAVTMVLVMGSGIEARQPVASSAGERQRNAIDCIAS